MEIEAIKELEKGDQPQGVQFNENKLKTAELESEK